MTPTRISQNLLSNCAKLLMMISMHLLKKPVLKVQTRAHSQPYSPSSATRYAPNSPRNSRQSLERKSRIIYPQPKGWYWQQQAEQNPQMASSRRLTSVSRVRANSVAGDFTRQRYVNTALTVSLSQSYTSVLATASLDRSAVAKYPRAYRTHPTATSGTGSLESTFCRRTNLPFIDYAGRSDIKSIQLQKIYPEEYRLKGRGREGAGAIGQVRKEGLNEVAEMGGIQMVACYRNILANSMPEEGANRSLTSSDYVQTKFTTLASPTQGGHNYVPFLHKSSRFTSSNHPTAPPIGTYNLPSCFERKKFPFEDRISHFLVESQRSNHQMGVFKSALTRFHQPASNSPGPASYNLFNQTTPPKKPLTRAEKENIEMTKTCPSIPHKGNKYGYAIVNGEMKKIEKSELQLEKQKQSRKHYVDTLQGERNIFRESIHRDFHDSDERRRLFELTSKYVAHKGEQNHSKSQSNLLRKPKYEHLYHSKPAPLSNQHKLIGPGQYQVSGKLTATRKDKFQFFGSTEVRFKERNSPEKGYSLLEMIKEGQNIDVAPIQKKQPFKKKMVGSRIQQALPATLPGPGEYNPQVQYSKQSRRTAFFPAEQRFKERSQDCQDQEQDGVMPDFGKSRSKKNYNANSLKKERFKPIHQDYQPVRSEQICGIVNESNDATTGKSSPKRAIGKLLKLNSKRGTQADNLQINSWSRQQSRKKGAYIRQLKDQLAFISYSPLPEEASKKQTKKLQRKAE